ncbi:riboflavin synthase [Rickettsiales bacterium]|nr:riboflavin synthase [Rickettsiales bacterium]
MFTGLITHIAQITNITITDNQDLILTIAITQKDLKNSKYQIGSSIACSGMCLTVTKLEQKDDYQIFTFEVSPETIAKTNISSWEINNFINVEFSLRIGDEIGGHLVSGHVDTIANIHKIHQANEDSWIFTFKISNEFKKFICQKGSITINGISLTVNDVIYLDEDNFLFQINIISHTFANTNLQFLNLNNQVNIEIDMLARYIANAAKNL